MRRRLGCRWRRLDGSSGWPGLGAQLGDLVDRVAGPPLGLGGTLLGLSNPIKHFPQAFLALYLLSLQLRESVRPRRPGLGLLGARLYFLELLGGALERVGRTTLLVRESRLGLLQLAGQILLLGVAAGELVLGPAQFGQKRLTVLPALLHCGSLRLYRLETLRGLVGLADALVGFLSRPLDTLLRLSLPSLRLSLPALGLTDPPLRLSPDSLLLTRRRTLGAPVLDLLQPSLRRAFGRIADRTLLVGSLAAGPRDRRRLLRLTGYDLLRLRLGGGRLGGRRLGGRRLGGRRLCGRRFWRPAVLWPAVRACAARPASVR